MNKRVGRLPLIIVGTLFAVFALVFILTLVEYGPLVPVVESVSDAALRETVNRLLIDADAGRGEVHSNTYGCATCHVAGAVNNVAPPFAGIADIAAQRRLPMPADVYLYESIVNPGAYIVDSYGNAMPQNYAQRMSEAELGDMIAYLLTQAAEQPPAS